MSPIFAAISIAIVAIGLLCAGAALLAVTIWFWFAARPEPAMLGPLEIMSEPEFANASEDQRQQLLNSVRPIPKVDSQPTPTSDGK